MSEPKWVDWHPKPGDVRPEVYRVKDKDDSKWTYGVAKGVIIGNWDTENYDYQIPASKETAMGAKQPTPPPKRGM